MARKRAILRREALGTGARSRVRLAWMRNAARLYSEMLPQARLRTRCLPHFYGLTAVAATLFFSISLLPKGSAVFAQANEPTGKLPTLTTARAAHGLTSDQAARAYPVHLQGVVTYFDPDYGTGYAAIFVHDSTGSIFLKPRSDSVQPLTAGTLVDVQGVSGPGGFGPVVVLPRIRAIGRSSLPANPPRESLSHLETGVEDAQWVEVEGTIHGVVEYSHSVTLQLATIDGTVSVTMQREAGVTYAGLVDADVRIDANAAPTVNSNNQMIGVHLMAPNLSAVTVVKSAPGDPFRQPIVPIDRLLHWEQFSASSHRVHLRGNVTLQWPGSSLCIRDATSGICVQTVQDTPLTIGELVDVAGFAGTEDNTPVLTDAISNRAGKSSPVAAEPVSAEQALLGKYDSDLIQIDGQLIGNDLASSDTTLLVASGTTIFAAILPKSMAGPQAIPWEIGSRLRITGICSVRIDTRSNVREGVAVTKSFRVLMRSPQDVVVLRRPSWWTPGHALVVLALALVATLVVLGWVMVLRRRVEEQTILLRKSEENFRHMALHDALTGLATRLLLQDRLEAAIEAARRHKTGLALLMVDVDKFKSINDTFGHHGGDEVLRVTAMRLLEAVRKSDTVARMGGDEFVILLTDLHDPQIAERIASNIVDTLAVPIAFAGRELSVSVSVGVCSASLDELDAEALMRCADAALYQAKTSGRNRFQVFTSEVAGA
jgi:diguanylate cyclase (GGDEF)-like protein